MMPKFRAWDKAYKMMMVVNQIDFEDRSLWLEADNGDHETRHTITRDFDEVILMQSTGLKDQKGVEIYEDDIVKVTDEYGDTNFSDGGIGTICGLSDLYTWYIDGQVQNDLYVIEQCYYIEVVGNIYENPELLEVSDD